MDNERNMFVDEAGRVRIFHGVNAVYKTPFHPQTDTFDPLHSLSEQDVENFVEWGFNIVRLGVLWVGVEPTRNQVNQTYLDVMLSIVDRLQQNNIYTMVDGHQDVWSRQFCGEGAPEWTVTLPLDTAPFPVPVAPAYPTKMAFRRFLSVLVNHFGHTITLKEFVESFRLSMITQTICKMR